MRTVTAAVCEGGVDGRPVRTSLRRGPRPVVLACGGCGNWLAVGHGPDDPAVRDVLLACSSCGRVNDPSAAAADGAAPPAEGPPGGLAPAEVWGRATVERVHTLAAEERRWPWRPGTGPPVAW